MLEMIGRTLELVAISSALSVVLGVSLGTFVTHRAGADFHDVVVDLTNLGQTFPPVAVFALAVPLLGFGVLPTVLALTLYGVLPVLQNTIAGMQALPSAVIESAAGMGMGPSQSLRRIELPLASPVILAGIRVSVDHQRRDVHHRCGGRRGRSGRRDHLRSRQLGSRGDPSGRRAHRGPRADPRRLPRSAREGRGTKRRNQDNVVIT